VLSRYPAAKAGLEGWVVRLDVEPREMPPPPTRGSCGL